MKQPAHEFQKQIQDLQEVDIGDFRRRLALYINRLEEELEDSQEIKNLLQVMKNEALYRSCEMEELREGILQKTSLLVQKISQAT